MYVKNPISTMFLNGRHKRTFELISDLTPKKILDVGCDDGHFLSVLAGHFDSAKLFGCDTDNTVLSVASNTCPNAKITIGDFSNLKFDKVDLISMLEVLEHQTNPKKMLLKAKSTLGKEGRLLVSIPRSELLHWRMIWWAWSNTFGRRWLGQHTGISEKQLIEMASDCGFKLERKSYFFFGCISIMLLKG